MDEAVILYGKTARPHIIWLSTCILCCLGLYFWYTLEDVHGGSTAAGLATGILAGVIILFEFLIWPRKSIRSVQRLGPIPLGSAKAWMRAHIWLGLLSLPLSLFHSGFHFGGSFTTAFMILFFIVIGSGVLGLAIQNIVPRLMLRNLPAETIYSAIPNVSMYLADDAEALVRSACGARYEAAKKPEDELVVEAAEAQRVVVVGAIRDHGRLRGRVLATQAGVGEIKEAKRLQSAFDAEVRPYLLDGKRGCRRLASEQAATAYFRKLNDELGEDAASVVDSLGVWCSQRRQFERQVIYHWWLHGWLIIHVALSVAVLLFLVVHIWFALKYW